MMTIKIKIHAEKGNDKKNDDEDEYDNLKKS